MAPSKAAFLQAAFLEAIAAAARAEVVATEFFLQEFVSVHDAHTAFDFRLGWESLPAFAHRLEKNGCSSKLLVDMGHLHSCLGSETNRKCPRQELNLVLDLRRVACDPAHSKDV